MNYLTILPVAIVLSAATVASAVQSLDVVKKSYPLRPVRVIVSAAPGGSSDAAARIISLRLSERLGQQFVIDNRGGGGGILGTGVVAKAEADGYTLGFVSLRHAVNPSLIKLPFDSVRDFAPISLTAAVGNVLVVSPKSSVMTVVDLIQAAKQNKQAVMTFSSSGIGGAPHLIGEFFAQQTGITLTHIAYKGGSPAVADVVAGNVTMSFASMPSALPFIKSNRLRPLAVASKDRSFLLPEVPTMVEAGAGRIEVRDWQGYLAPRGVPLNIVQYLGGQVQSILKEPDTKQRFSGMGMDIVASSPDEFLQIIKADVLRWSEVIKLANIKVE